MAKENSNTFQEAVELYSTLKGLEGQYQAAAPVALMPKIAAEIAEEEGDETAAKYLLDPKTPDYLKIPFLEARVKKLRKESGEFVTKNLEGILENAPDGVLANGLGRINPKEKAKTLKEYYESKYDDKNEDEKAIKKALLGLYLSVPQALDQRYAEILADKLKDKKALAKFIAETFKSDEDKLAFFESLFRKQEE
jgi:hypothetical protein